MNKPANEARKQYERTIDFLLEDVNGLSDVQVDEELRLAFGDLAAADAVVARALAGATHARGAVRLAQAKAALKEMALQGPPLAMSGSEAKAAVLQYWRTNPGERPVTMAARHGQALSEEDALEVYRSLLALGVFPSEPHGQ